MTARVDSVITIYQECRVCGHGWITTLEELDIDRLGQCPHCGAGWIRTLRIRVERNPDSEAGPMGCDHPH